MKFEPTISERYGIRKLALIWGLLVGGTGLFLKELVLPGAGGRDLQVLIFAPILSALGWYGALHYRRYYRREKQLESLRPKPRKPRVTVAQLLVLLLVLAGLVLAVMELQRAR